MSLLDTALAKVEDLGAHLQSLAASAVPALEADTAKLASLQASPIVKALEGIVLTPEGEQFIADTVGYLASRYGQPAAPAADSPADDAQQPAA